MTCHEAKMHPTPPEIDPFEVWWKANRHELLIGLTAEEWEEVKQFARRSWKAARDGAS